LPLGEHVWGGFGWTSSDSNDSGDGHLDRQLRDQFGEAAPVPGCALRGERRDLLGGAGRNQLGGRRDPIKADLHGDEALMIGVVAQQPEGNGLADPADS